jgi:hypothetical protein
MRVTVFSASTIRPASFTAARLATKRDRRDADGRFVAQSGRPVSPYDTGSLKY